MNEPKHHDDPLEPVATEEAAAEAPETAAAPEPEAAPDVASLEAELTETKDRLLRSLAEVENTRRRATRDVEEAHKYAITNFARELLDVSDNLSRALDAVPARARDEIGFVKNLVEGVAMTEKALLACFERHQIARVCPGIGDRFDHNRHQAMFEVETDEHDPGVIAQVMQPGYTIADRLLRPALVGVAKAPQKKEASAEAPEAPATDAPDGQPGERVDTTA